MSTAAHLAPLRNPSAGPFPYTRGGEQSQATSGGESRNRRRPLNSAR
jgi:hypothetical protein